MDEPEQKPKPPSHVTKRLFRRWQYAKRATVAAEDMTNPVWEWLFRGRIDPYVADKQFEGTIARFVGRSSIPSQPRWAGCRMGQSKTQLADGRTVWIAGEHEDHYDPDFYIYNDVIFELPNGKIQMWGYPDNAFRPTDFHSATLLKNNTDLLLIGNLGYPEDRRIEHTQIYRLNLDSMEMTEILGTGCQPGWIHDHEISQSEDGTQLLLSGGKVYNENGIIENIDEWSLQLSDMNWSRLTERNWPRVRIFRIDFQMLHLWRYGTFDYYYDANTFDELTREIGIEPNLEIYKTLYQPSIHHQTVQVNLDPENFDNDDDSWCTKRIVVDGINMRITDDMQEVIITAEGDLQPSKMVAIADEFRDRISILENSECHWEWIHSGPKR